MAKANTATTETATEKVSRKRLSPQEKAVKTLGQAQKRYDRASERRAKYDADVAAMDTELGEAERFLTFAKGSRHLAENQEVLGESEPVSEDEADVETFDPNS